MLVEVENLVAAASEAVTQAVEALVVATQVEMELLYMSVVFPTKQMRKI